VRDLDPQDIRAEAPRVASVEAETDQASARSPLGAAPRGEHLRPAQITSLQRMAGNAAVAQLLGDHEEEEHGSESEGGEHDGSPGASVHDLLAHDAGTPLDGSTRAKMEPAFGHSFDSVRVHQSDAASASAQRLDAKAYTVGNDIVMGSGQPDPASAAGQRVLAHELTHVVQQSNGPVDGTAAGGGVAISDPGDRFEREAEHTADAVMNGKGTHMSEASVGVQRMSEGEEEEGSEEEGSE
jgi:hypothetical protein